MKRSSLVLLSGPALATLALFACDDSSGGSSSGSFTFDGGQFDASVFDTSAPDTFVPPVDAGPAPVTVQVNRYLPGVPDVVVVWNDASGAILGTGKTDANGRVVIPAPAPAMVSVLLGSVATATHVVTWAGVKEGDVLRASDVDVTGMPVSQYAVSLNTATIPNTSTGVNVRTGTCTPGGFAPDPAQVFEVILTGACAATPGAVLATSHDGAANPAIDGYSFAKNLLPVGDGGTVAVTTGAWAAPVDFTLSVTNRPNADTLVDPWLTEIAGSIAFPNETFPTPQLDVNGNAVYKIPSGFADAQQYGFELGTFAGGNSFYSRRVVGKRAAPATTGTLDFADLLPELTSATIDTTDPVRPSITWQSAQSLATTDGGSVNLRWFAGSDFYAAWTVIVPPSATTGTLKLPALPASASAWAPPATDGGQSPIQPPSVLFIESDALPGYDALRSVGGLAIPPLNAGGNILRDIALPTNGKVRITFVEPNIG